MKLKVCGMKNNTQEVAALLPDYLGFIFWEPSKRFFEGEMPHISTPTKKYDLWGVQLHGKESAEYCTELKIKLQKIKAETQIIKVFSIRNNFDFRQLNGFEAVCDYYLFDTKGELPGGNGYTFNWEVLKDYPSTKPYFLSGGIGLEEINAIKAFQKRPEAKYCHVIDVNSKFESEPGLKNIKELKKFKEKL